MTYAQKYLIYLLFFLLNGSTLWSQHAIDRAVMYTDLFNEYEYEDSAKARIYSDSVIFYAELSGDTEMIGRAYQYKGWFYQNTTEHSKAQECFLTSLKQYRLTGRKDLIADAFGNLGNSFLDTYEYTKALEYQLKSLKLNEQILASPITGDNRLKAMEGRIYALHNIGTIYNEVGIFKKAIDFYKMSLEGEVIAKNKVGEAISCSGIGEMYQSLEIPDSAIYYFQRAISLFLNEGEGNAFELAHVYLAYSTLKDTDLSEEDSREMLLKSLSIFRNMSDREGELDALVAYGEAYFDDLSRDSLGGIIRRCESLISQFDYLSRKEDFLKLKASYLARIGKYDLANNALKDYIALLSVNEEEKVGRDLMISDVKYEMQKKLINDSLKLVKAHDIERAIDQEKISEQSRLITIGVIGGVALLILLFGLYRANGKRKRMNSVLYEKNGLIQRQKETADVRNREISDSIRYATRLQSAILPKQEDFNRFFNDSFVMYRPKDLVSGDFYWLEAIGDYVFLAVADCTGHGVPGAMVSVVCNNALNRSIHEFELRSPDEILNKTRELVIDTFANSDEYVDDGMDIGLCVFDQKNHLLRYAGANNPLWLVRDSNGTSIDARRVTEANNARLFEVSGDKQPIGKYPKMEDFKAVEIRYSQGDRIYLCSDGFADQFGGEEEKKYRSLTMKNGILSVCEASMNDQGEFLINEFENWMGEIDQVDDVCIVGIKL